MKRRLVLATSAIIVLAFSLILTDIVTAQDLPIIAISPKVSSCAPTTTFVINVTISGVTLANTGGYGITAWEVYINFSSTVLNAVSAMEGPWLKTAGTTRKVSLKIDNSTDPGYIIVSYSLFPPKTAGALGSGTLCNVTFQAMNAGRSNLTFHKTLLRAYTGSTYLTISNDVANGYFQYPIGDADGDGNVDYDDFIILAGAYGSHLGQPAYKPNADFDHDDDVDYDDFIKLAGNYGKSG